MALLYDNHYCKLVLGVIKYLSIAVRLYRKVSHSTTILPPISPIGYRSGMPLYWMWEYEWEYVWKLDALHTLTHCRLVTSAYQ